MDEKCYYCTDAVGFHYETYGEISPSRTLSIHFTAKFDVAVSDKYSYEKIYTASSGTAIWADLSTVVTCAEMSPSCLPNDAVCIHVL